MEAVLILHSLIPQCNRVIAKSATKLIGTSIALKKVRSPNSLKYYLSLLCKLEDIDSIKIQVTQLGQSIDQLKLDLASNTQADIDHRNSKFKHCVAKWVGTVGTAIIGGVSILAVSLLVACSAVEEMNLERGELKTRQVLSPEALTYIGNAIALAGSAAVVGAVGGKEAIASWILKKIEKD